eukprot:349785-Chlamydomonas_euryale.AAC.17
MTICPVFDSLVWCIIEFPPSAERREFLAFGGATGGMPEVGGGTYCERNWEVLLRGNCVKCVFANALCI